MQTRRDLLKAAALSLAACAIVPAAFAAEEDSLEAVKKRGALRIGVTPADPWFFKDPMSQKWVGVGMMLGANMAKELGVQLTPVETTWGNSVAAIQAGQIDLMYVLDPTEERKKAIDFPEKPLFYYAMGALIHDDMKVTNWQDLNKKARASPSPSAPRWIAS